MSIREIQCAHKGCIKGSYQEGSALISAVLFLAVSTAAAAGIASLASSSAESSADLLDSERAFYAAESGFQRLGADPSLSDDEYPINDDLTYVIDRSGECSGASIIGRVSDGSKGRRAEHLLCRSPGSGWSSGQVGLSHLFLPENDFVSYWTGGAEGGSPGKGKTGDGVWKKENNPHVLFNKDTGAVTFEEKGKGFIHRPPGKTGDLKDLVAEWEEIYFGPGEHPLTEASPEELYILVDASRGAASGIRLGPGKSDKNNGQGAGKTINAEKLERQGKYQVFRFDLAGTSWEDFDHGGGAVQLHVEPEGDSATVTHGFFDANTNDLNLYEQDFEPYSKWRYYEAAQ